MFLWSTPLFLEPGPSVFIVFLCVYQQDCETMAVIVRLRCRPPFTHPLSSEIGMRSPGSASASAMATGPVLRHRAQRDSLRAWVLSVAATCRSRRILSLSLRSSSGVSTSALCFLLCAAAVLSGTSAHGQAFLTRQTASAPWRAVGGVPATVFNGMIVTGPGNLQQCGPLDQQVAISKDVGSTWSVSDSASYPVWYGGVMISWASTILLIGGTQCNVGYANTIYSTTDGASWTYVSNMPWGGRIRFGAVVKQLPSPAVYLFGNYGTTSDVWVSSAPVTPSSWSQITASAPWSARSEFAFALTPSERVIIGGPDLWISNIDVTSWTSISPVGSWFGPRLGGSMVTLGARIFHFAGADVSLTNFYNDVWVSSDEGTSWMLVSANGAPGMFSPRRRQTVLAVGNKILLMSGLDSATTPLNDVWYAYV